MGGCHIRTHSHHDNTFPSFFFFLTTKWGQMGRAPGRVGEGECEKGEATLCMTSLLTAALMGPCLASHGTAAQARLWQTQKPPFRPLRVEGTPCG